MAAWVWTGVVFRMSVGWWSPSGGTGDQARLAYRFARAGQRVIIGSAAGAGRPRQSCCPAGVVTAPIGADNRGRSLTDL